MNRSNSVGRNRRQTSSSRIVRAALLAAPAVAAAWVLSPAAAQAANRYWDLNADTAGAGGATPAGTWDEGTFNWNPTADGTGITTFFTGADTPIFSAGSDATGAFTITVDDSLGDNNDIMNTVGLTVQEGTVTFVGDGIALDGATVSVSAGASANLTNAVSGTLGLTKTGGGTLILSGTNTFTGITTVNSGTLTLDHSTNNTSKIDGTSELAMGGGTLNLIGINGAADTTQTVNGLSLAASSSSSIVVTKGDTQNTTLNLGAINRSALALADFATAGTGAGTATITTTATNTGNILGNWATFGKTGWASVSGGNLTALGTYATNDFSAATNDVDVTSNQSPAADFTVATLRFNTAAPVTLTTTGNNNATTGILVTSNVGANTTTIAGGLISGSGELIVHQHNTAGDLVVSGFSGSANVVKGGAGTMVLNGSSTNSGGFTVAGGTLRLGANETIDNAADVVLGSNGTFDVNSRTEAINRITGSGTLLVDGGTLSVTTTGNSSFTGPVPVGAGGATFNQASATATQTFTGVISGSARWTKSGPGTMFLNTGSNSFSGGARVTGGTLIHGTFESSNPTAGTLRGSGVTPAATVDDWFILDGGTLHYQNVGSGSTFLDKKKGITLGANGGGLSVIDSADSIAAQSTNVFSDVKLAAGVTSAVLYKRGFGEIRANRALAGDPAVDWDHTQLVIESGFFRVGNLAQELAFGQVPAVYTPDAIRLSGVGTNRATGGAAIGTTPSITTPAERGITIDANGGTFVTSGSWVINSIITGAGGLALNGNGWPGASTTTLTLNGANSYAGNTQVNLATLRANGGVAIPDTSVVNINGASTATTVFRVEAGVGVTETIAALTGGGTAPGSFGSVAIGPGTLAVGANNGNFSFDGNITDSASGAGLLEKVGNGTWTINNWNLSNTGGTGISAGTLKLGVNAGLADGALVAIAGSGTFDMSGSSDSIGGLEGSGPIINGGNITLQGLGLTYSGNYSGGGALTKEGTGEQNLSGTNAFSAVNANGGVLGVQSSGAISGNLTAQNDALVKFAPNGAITTKLGTVAVTGTAKIDLADNKLITTSPAGTWDGVSAYTGVAGLVDVGRGNAGNALWDGTTGIVTTDTRAINNGDLVSIGVAKASEVRTVADTATTTFGGQTVLGSDTLVMATWGGDANLDGKINIDDYGRIDGNVGQSGSVFGWSKGDFNYDGKINIDDYGIIDGNINRQGAVFPTAGGVGGAALDGVAAVPEPASLSLLAVGAAGLLRRRRRT